MGKKSLVCESFDSDIININILINYVKSNFKVKQYIY